MLPRILEPEVMDSVEEASDYDAMDHSTVNRVFVADFLAVWDGHGPVLDVGTGTARIPIELCRRDARPQVVGVDLAEHMLALGQRNVEHAGMTSRIRLDRCDAKTLPYSPGMFGAVISNSIIHHIPDPSICLAEMDRVAAAGAVLFVRDLLRPQDGATLDHLVRTHAGDANSHQQQMFRDSLHAALTLDELRERIARLGYDPTAVRQTTDRHWTWIARKA